MSQVNADFVKLLLFSFNILFVLSGFVLLIVGVNTKIEFTNQPFLDDRYILAADFLITIGVVVFIITIIGCYGIFKENVCMTLMFTTLLILILFLELAAGIGGFFLEQTTEQYIKTTLANSLNHYNLQENVTLAWDDLHTKFQCCGIKGANDWETVKFSQLTFPDSCVSNLDTSSYFQNGCLPLFVEHVKWHTARVEVTGLTLACLQLLGVSLSCYLSSEIRRSYMIV